MCTGMDLSAGFVVKSTICTLSSRTRFAWPPAQDDRMELLPMFDGIMFVALESTACALPSRWAAGVHKFHFLAPGPWGRGFTHHDRNRKPPLLNTRSGSSGRPCIRASVVERRSAPQQACSGTAAAFACNARAVCQWLPLGVAARQ